MRGHVLVTATSDGGSNAENHILNSRDNNLESVTSNTALTFWAEASQCLRFGGGHISQAQRPLVEVLVGEQVGQTHSRGVVSDV